MSPLRPVRAGIGYPDVDTALGEYDAQGRVGGGTCSGDSRRRGLASASVHAFKRGRCVQMDCQMGFLWFGVKAGTAVTLHDPLYVDRSIQTQYIIEFEVSRDGIAYSETHEQ